MADDDDDAQKTEEPTEKKLSTAKEKGQVGTSQEVKSFVILLGGALGVVFLAPWMMEDVVNKSILYLANADAIHVDFDSIQVLFVELSIGIGITLAPICGLLVLLALSSSLAQSGWIWAPTKIKPEVSKISVLKGVKRMFSLRSVVEFLKSIFKLLIVSLVCFLVTVPLMVDAELMPGYSIMAVLDRIYTVAIVLTVAASAVMLVIAGLDFAYQKFDFTKSMRMTKQEVKDEYKQAEGDPHIKAKIRQLRAERSQQRMMAAVPEADVVITNPTHFAVALSYNIDDMQAPVVVAKGIDSLAFRIRDMAKEHDVAVVENPPLARALYASVEVDGEIPMEHYKAVAEIIGYVMRLKGDNRFG